MFVCFLRSVIGYSNLPFLALSTSYQSFSYVFSRAVRRLHVCFQQWLLVSFVSLSIDIFTILNLELLYIQTSNNSLLFLPDIERRK